MVETPSTSRRRLLAAAGVGASAALAGCAATAPDTLTPSVDAAGWPMAGHDPGHTSHNPHATPPTDPPEVAWRTEYTAPYPQYARTPNPVVADGQLLVGGEMLDCYDAHTGAHRWTHDPVDPVYGLAVHDETAYATRWTRERGATLATYRLPDTTPEWSVSPDWGLLTPPLVANGDVFVADTTRLFALDADAGTVHWTVEKSGFAFAPAVTADSVYITRPVRRVTRLSRAHGILDRLLGSPPNTLWADHVSGRLAFTPAARDDTAFVPVSRFGRFESENDGTLTAYAADGTERWQHVVGSRCLPPAVTPQAVYAVTHRTTDTAVQNDVRYSARDATIRAYDPRTGEPRWSEHYPGLGGGAAPPVTADGVVYAALDGNPAPADDSPKRPVLVAVDGDGERWRRTLPAPAVRLVLAGDFLYAALRDGTLLALASGPDA
ncbi:outer membrane protein assembly factor BamB family protein [Salarchaeum japonicum]|uniref:Pyrrolo-quinoline quinone repeat domain-containing protein n=1 Tax=Salarchaeum japonicum TaxID=555573 RepID=A0AAV3T249_9EURY|nr:PQQ-binding-like beta-propeller repeat protein [Salarchaeum japonicum]